METHLAPAGRATTQATDPDTEAHWLARARRGDAQAFARLYHAHATAIHTLALRLTGDRGTAEDITQEAFLRMFRLIGGMRAGQPVRPWLRQVAARLAIDRLRRNTHAPTGPNLADTGVTRDATEHQNDAARLLSQLTPQERALVWLSQMEGWSHAELGQRFGHSESWSKSIVARAMARLRSQYTGASEHD